MRNEARSGKSQGRGVQRSNRGFFPNSLKAISSYLRSATSVASNLRSSASSVAHSDNHAASSDLVQWAGFDKLELGENVVRRVLHLGYSNGFQVWDVEEADNIRELVSKQDGLVSFLQMQPCPYTNESAADGFSAHRPLLIVVPGEENYPGGTVQGSCAVGYGGPSHSGSNSALCSVVQFYSLKSHSYVNTWRFRSAVCTVRCSPRIVAVALVAQIHCFDAATLQSKFSVLTYPVPQGMQSAGSSNVGYGPLALGPRWMAYAANHAVVPNTGRGSPQLTPSPGVSPSTSPANGNLVAHYAKESSKQIAASLMTLGDMGYKTITKYCSELRPDGSNSPRAESQSWRSSCNSLPGQTCETEFAGTVVVRDFVGKITIAQFRAHTSPLSALCFDPSGTLLVTASIHGHSLNVFRIMPSSKGNSTFDNGFTHVHLYKLHRGLRDAIIQDISFSDDSHWIVISSARGTNHLFAISPFGGPIGRHTHEETLTNFSRVASLVPSPKLCWWLGSRSFRANHSSLQPCSMSSPITLSVISRIKDRNAGWRGTVSDAAAAAAGRSISSSGAVTAVFHGGKSNAALSEKQNLICKKQIWIFYPSGYLIQYSLRLDNGAEGAYLNNTNSQISGACSEPSDQDLKVVVETIQKWDVFQVPNRVDREEDITSLFKLETSCSRAGRQEFGCGRNGVISPAGKDDAGNNGTVYEEKHHWHLSNAEVQMHQSKTPIWAKAEIFFHVMMPDHSIQDSVGGEVEIERIPSRVIEVKTHDLIPVFNNRSKSTNFQTNRISGSETVYSHKCKYERSADSSVDRTQSTLQAKDMDTKQTRQSSNFSLEKSQVLNGCYPCFPDLNQHKDVLCQPNVSDSSGYSTPKAPEKMVPNANNEELQEKSAFQGSKGSIMMDFPICSTAECGLTKQETLSAQNNASPKYSLIDVKYRSINSSIGAHENTHSDCAESSRSSDSNTCNYDEGNHSGALFSDTQVMDIPMQYVCKEDTHALDHGNTCSEQVLLEGKQNDDKRSKNVKQENEEGFTENLDTDGWDESLFPFCVEE